MDSKDIRIAELEALLKNALEEIARLKAKLNTNSSNSSKPPSSDLVKPPKQQQDRRRKKRKIGGQKGHKQHLRQPFAEDQVDETIELKLKACPKCGGKLQPMNEPPKKHQQVELVEKPFIVTEFQQHQYWCEKCQCYHTAKLPPEVKRAGLFGKNITALTGYLKGRCHLSYTTLQSFYSDALRLRVSRGFLAKQIRRASESLKKAHEELVEQLPKEEHLHIDETGGKENGDLRWNWCFRAEDFTVFHIDPSRGSVVLENILGTDFAGKISSDFFSAYRKFARLSSALPQYCWAHLIREVKYFSESDDKSVARYGKRLLEEIGEMFKTIHRQDKLSERTWLRRMRRHQESILKWSRFRVPKDKKVQALSKRLRDYPTEYFRFIESGLPPTNNLCEQSIRRVVIDRKVTQGTRSDWGNRWLERFWSVLSTCEQRGKNVMEFLKSCMDALIHGLSPPKLLQD